MIAKIWEDEGMIKEAVDQYTAEEEEAELEMEKFRDALNQMYRQQTDWYPESHLRNAICRIGF